MKHINPEVVKAQIASLLAAYPELKDDEESLILSLESETDTTALLEQLVRNISETKAMVNGLEGYISDLRGRVDMLDRRVEAWHSLILKIMQTADIKNASLTSATVIVKLGQPKVIVTEHDRIPFEFRRVPPWQPDKDAIARSLKANITVDGCVLSNAEPTLTIRTK